MLLEHRLPTDKTLNKRALHLYYAILNTVLQLIYFAMPLKAKSCSCYSRFSVKFAGGKGAVNGSRRKNSVNFL